MSGPVVYVSATEPEARAMLDDSWDELVRAQARPNPTLLAGWLDAMLSRDRGRLAVIRVEHDGRLLAAAALSLYHPLGRRGPTFARWPGDPLQWFNPDILVHPDHDTAASTLLDTILQQAHALYVPCRGDSALAHTLRARDPRTLHRWPSAEGWIAPIPLPRDAHMRRLVGRDMRQAERKGARNDVHVASSSAEVAAALERMFALHQTYWNTRPDLIPRFSATEELRALNRAAVLNLAKNNEAFVVEVLENGEPVAASLGLIAGHGLVTHTSATRRHTVLREPGYASLLAEIDHAAAEGATLADLGSGAGGPGTVKGRAGAIQVPIQRIMCARSPWVLRACRSLVFARDRAQQAGQHLHRARTEASKVDEGPTR